MVKNDKSLSIHTTLFSYFSQSHWQAGRKRGKALPQWHLGPTSIGKASLKSWAQEGIQSCQTHSRCFLPNGQYCSQQAMSVLGLQRKQDFNGPLTWNLGCWAELEVYVWISNLFASNSGWQAHCSLLSLLPWRRLTLIASCEFPVPGCWRCAFRWRSAVVPANFLLQIKGGKHTAACCLFIPEGVLLFPHSANFLSQASRKAFLRVHFLRAVIPEPGLLGRISSLKRKGTATYTNPMRPFCSVGEV